MEQLQYTRALFLVRLGESENVEAPEKADFRRGLLSTAEESLRSSLKQLMIDEEVAFLKDKVGTLSANEIDK